MNNGNSSATLSELQEYNRMILSAILVEETSTVQYLGYTFDTSGNYPHTILMNGQFADLSLSGGFTWPSNFTWADINGTNVAMTALQAVQFSSTLFTYTQLCYANYNSHLTAIAALTTVPNAQAYDVTTGWPTYGSTYTDVTAGALYQNSRRPQVNTIDCGSNTVPYCNSTSTAWVAMRRFSFRGTANSGTPTSIKAVSYISNTSATGLIRIQDVTNGLTICSTATFNNNTAAIINLANIANLSANEAIWEVQIKSSTTTNTVYINSVNIYF